MAIKSRLSFDAQGKLAGVDGKMTSFDESFPEETTDLKKSDSLKFLQEKSFQNIFDHGYWSLYKDGCFLEPLKFSNGKTQEDVVKEIVSLVSSGTKIIFLHGTCGTGKSAIALNVARLLGKASIVVPVKALQKQYEEDYTEKMNVIGKSGKQMKIAMLTGRENHDSIFKPGFSCADPSLPENIKISEKNYNDLVDYYNENPYLSQKDSPELKNIRRLAIAPANPYWSPILPADLEINTFSDAKKHRYKGADGRDWIFYHRKSGCSYYDQYLSYSLADVTIFNSAKYLSEMDLGRKPVTEVEIIDEADDFLDNLFQQKEINLTKTINGLSIIPAETEAARAGRNKIIELLELEEKNKAAIGVDENKIYPIFETKLVHVFDILNNNSEIESEIAIEELNYANKILEAARMFKNSLSEVYLNYKKDEEGLSVYLVSTNLSGRFNDLAGKSKAMIFMSGTLHSEKVLKNIFKINNYRVVEAETLNHGNIDLIMTGKEIDCRYSSFTSKKHTRGEYLEALSSAMSKSIKPVLVHVHAFQDLPNDSEKRDFRIFNLSSSEELIASQRDDKSGNVVSSFKQGKSDSLFSTKCSRGVDFPGKMCNSIIFTKYPNPNVKDIFWKVLQEKHPNNFWDFYRDKARREFLQRIYRALRSKEDHVYILSPDKRVLDSVRELQVAAQSNKNLLPLG